MRIRPYIESRDYKYIEKWVGDEKNHALWCANLIPYPVTKENLHDFLEKTAVEWTDSAYVATDTNGKIIGFFCYSINVDNNTGFLRLVIIDHNLRGKGYGKEMLKLALQYAFEMTGVKLVQLYVFDENVVAKHCYEQVGFIEESITQNAFIYKNELWNRCLMIVTK